MPGGFVYRRSPSDAVSRPLGKLLRLGLVRGTIPSQRLEKLLSSRRVDSAEFDLFLELAGALQIPIRSAKSNGKDAKVPAVRHTDPDREPRVSGLQIYFRALKAYPPLSADEERDVMRRVKKGDHEARNHMIRCNLRLVVFHARRYQGRGVAFDDLIEEGNLGLFQSVERFDPERGFRFSTYASWWIRHSLGQAVAHYSRTVQLPLDFLRRLHQMLEAERTLAQKLGRFPTEDELSAHLKTPVKSVRRLKSMRDGSLSLDASSSDGDGIPFIRNLPAREDVEKQVEARLQRTELESWLKELTTTEEKIVRARFGFDDGQPCTLAEVSRRIGRSRERVRQLEKRALGRLRERALAPVPAVGKDGSMTLQAQACT